MTNSYLAYLSSAALSAVSRTIEVTCRREGPPRCGVVAGVSRKKSPRQTSALAARELQRTVGSCHVNITLLFCKLPAPPPSSNINGCPALFCISTPNRIKRVTLHWLAPAIEELTSQCKACVRRLFAASTTYRKSSPTSPLHSCPTLRDRTFQRPAFPLPSRPAWPSLPDQVSSLPDPASRGPEDRYTRPVEPR